MFSFKSDVPIDVFLSDLPEREHFASVSGEHRKSLGQYFTPYPVADFMAAWVSAGAARGTILDPAVGTGIFLRAILGRVGDRDLRLVGYDVDAGMLERAGALLGSHATLELHQRDYLFHDWDGRYDGIIGNPPYRGFRDYADRARILQEFRKRFGLSIGGLSNIYVLFLLKAVSQLAENGRAAFLVPFEFLNANYGRPIKQFLLERGVLRYGIVFDSGEELFDGALTTSCILLLARDQYAAKVEFLCVKGISQLEELAQRLEGYPRAERLGMAVPFSRLDPGAKWRVYYRDRRSARLRNLVPLSRYGRMVRGIATGANDFFLFDVEKKRCYGIDDSWFLPCLPKASFASTHFFAEQDFEALAAAGKRVFLLNATSLMDPRVAAYLQSGEDAGIHRRYLTSRRNPWYALEKRPPAPILVTVFCRGGLRFVRNEAGVRHLTCFHGFYPREETVRELDILMAYFLTDICGEILSENRRDYGRGLGKFEPADLNGALVADLDSLRPAAREKILALYAAYRRSEMEHRPDVNLTGELDALFREHLGA